MNVFGQHGVSKTFELYFDDTVDPDKSPCNEGIVSAMRLFTQLEDRNNRAFKAIDTDDISPRELREAYDFAVAASVRRQYRIRQVFGSRRRSGVTFGREVPALLIYNSQSGEIEDVFPHFDNGDCISIFDGLDDAVESGP